MTLYTFEQLITILKPITVTKFMAYRFQQFYKGNISENHTSAVSGVFLRCNLKISLTLWSLVATRLYVPIVLNFKNSTVALLTHRTFPSSVQFSEQIANISPYINNVWFLIIEPECLLRGTD